MGFKVTRADGATWSTVAGGYVKDGKIVSTTPEYDTQTQQTIIPAQQNTSSIIPAAQQETQQTTQVAPIKQTIAPPVIPAAPTYKPYQRQEMQFTPSFRMGRPGQEQIVPTLAAEREWNAQENQKANDALNAFNSVYNTWKTNYDNAMQQYQLQLQQQNSEADRQFSYDQLANTAKYQQGVLGNDTMKTQADVTGLIPAATGNMNDMATYNIRLAQRAYEEAKAKGDTAGMNAAHLAAEQWRQSAGWGSGGADGSSTIGRMTMAGLPTYAAQQDTANLKYNQNRDAEQFRLTERGQDIGYAGDVMSNQTSRENSIRSTSASMNRTSSKPDTPEQVINGIYAAKEYYRSGDDYYNDIVKNKSQLILKVGKDKYDEILADAESSKGQNWEGINNWRPGKISGSPISRLLSDDVNPNTPTSQKTGIDSKIVSVVNSVAAKYGVDPALILAIGQHETGWGKLGDGRKGMYTGYGSYDSGSDYSNAGLEKQVEGTARKMAAWGMTRGNISLEKLRAGNTGKLPTGIYATDQNWPNAIWNYYQKYRGY